MTSDDGSVDGPREVSGSARRGRTMVRAVLPWVLYLFAAWILLYPLLTTAIVADDYLNPFFQFQQTRFSPEDLLRYTWNGTRSAGHFNYLGQLVGNTASEVSMFLMGDLGVRYSTIFATLKYLVFVGAALAAAGFVRAALDVLGRPQRPWTCRIVTSLLLFGSLQLHISWSNDPVGSYPLAGFAAAGVGFVVLALALRTYLDARFAWPTAIAAVLAVLYYELNVAAVLALVSPAIFAVATALWRRSGVGAAMRRWLPVLALPGLAGLALQVKASASSVNYGGTSINSDVGQIADTFRMALIGSLPGASWGLSEEWLGEFLQTSRRALLVWSVVIVGAAYLLVRHVRRRRGKEGSLRPLLVAMVVAMPLVYWVVATFLQATTAKVQTELPRIGYVYTFYAVGAMALAVLAALVFFLVPWRRLPAVVPIAVLTVVAAFFLVQLTLNWRLSARHNELTLPNQELLLAFTERPPMEERCHALLQWTAGAWPDYYELGMMEGVAYAYEHFHDEQFCPGFVRPG